MILWCLIVGIVSLVVASFTANPISEFAWICGVVLIAVAVIWLLLSLAAGNPVTT